MSESLSEFDVRTLSPENRLVEIIRILDGLAPGEPLMLVNDHNLNPLLRQVQAQRPGRFDWSIVEAGPTRFRIEIRRRLTESLRNVTEYLQADHQRLDAIIAEVTRLIDSGTFGEAGTRFAEFICGLGWHIDAEENILFPAFEQLTGITVGPTVMMRREHQDIRELMDAVMAAINKHDAVGAGQAIHQLTEVLSVHNRKEEHVLYPTTDRAAGSDHARDDLVNRIQAF